jgi:hypothetical protein
MALLLVDWSSVGRAKRSCVTSRRWPAHVEQRERPTAVVERRGADHDKAERDAEPARRGVLLVDVDGELGVAQRLGVCHQLRTASLPESRRLEDER